jgi:hypothetical protein
MKLLFPVVVLAILMANCKKSNYNSGADSQPPVVTLSSPINLQSFSAGQNIPISATITDNDTLASIHLNIEGPDFIHYAYACSGKTLNFTEDIPVPIKGKYSVTLEVFDKSGNHGEAKVAITVN